VCCQKSFDALIQRLQGSVPNDTTKAVKGQALSEERKKLAEEKKSKKEKHKVIHQVRSQHRIKSITF
jgi:hypothetical protein